MVVCLSRYAMSISPAAEGVLSVIAYTERREARCYYFYCFNVAREAAACFTQWRR